VLLQMIKCLSAFCCRDKLFCPKKKKDLGWKNFNFSEKLMGSVLVKYYVCHEFGTIN